MGYSDFAINDYVDIGEAVNAAAEEIDSSGGRIILPAGNFEQTTTITGGSRSKGLARIEIYGQGANSTTLTLADNADIRQLDYQPISTPSGETPQFFFSLKGLNFYGNKSSGNTKTSVFLGDVRDVRIRDVWINHSGLSCMRTASTWGHKIEASIFERANSHGYVMTGEGPENGFYSGCRFGSNGGNGALFSDAVDATFVGCEFDNNANGIKLINDTGTRLVSCTAAANANDGILLAGSSQPTIIGQTANANTNTAIEIDSSTTDATISSPTIRNDDITDNGVRTRINGIGSESSTTETPTAANWDIGTTVDYTDTDDGSGTGVYQLMPDGTWTQLA